MNAVQEVCTIGGGIGHNSSGGTLNGTTGDLTGAITCCNAGVFSTIGGGLRNCATGVCSTIGGGQQNTASGNGSTIGGGISNTASNTNSTIGGGECNTASGTYSTVGGGYCNTTSGNYSTIIGGRCNTISAVFGSYAQTVLGGYGNTANCSFSAVATYDMSTTAQCQLRARTMSKLSGTFQIDHPDPSKKHTHYLQHSFVESPTAGDNIYRWKVNVVNGQAVIQLPSYYKFLNENDQIWVTPQGHFGIGYGEINEIQTEVTIFANTDGEYNVLLIGTRKDHDIQHHWQGVETYK
jgi:hypothetical protein